VNRLAEMSLQGPIIVVAEAPVPAVVEPLGAAGAFPIIETRGCEIAAAMQSVEPAAIILADPESLSDAVVGDLPAPDLIDRPYVPVIVLTAGQVGPGHVRPASDWALPIDHDAPSTVLIARLRSALRVRTLHASVLRRVAACREHGSVVPPAPGGDPLEDATVIVAGRGRAYPALTVAIGERVGLIGALSLEAAAGFLKARDIDGVVIGDGFNKRMVETFVADLSNDARFRDLPIAVLDGPSLDMEPERLPNLDRVGGNPARVAGRILPLVRLHAFAGRLRRMATSLDQQGLVDPQTGLRTPSAFMRDLERAVDDAGDRGEGLALARFSFANLSDDRASIDAARIVARLVRTADFACRDTDGTILVAFAATELGAAHVVARRIASVLRHTTMAPGRDRGTLDPCIAIAALNSRDTIATLLARIAPGGMVAAS
jgi:GGDEF domain-containing protein